MSAKELVIGFCMSAVLASVAQGGQPRPKPLAIGDPAPDFQGVDLDGQTKTLASFKQFKLLVVCFTSVRSQVCRAYENRFNEFARDYQKKGVGFVAVSANQDENADMIRARHKQIRLPSGQRGFQFPYLYDASGASARRFGANRNLTACVLDEDRKVIYHGAWDDSLTKTRHHYVRNAVEAALTGQRLLRTRTTAYGPSIKFR